MTRETGSTPSTSAKKLLRVTGLPAVAALFSTAPKRIERLFFDQRMRHQVDEFCAALTYMRKPFRLVAAEELNRVAGSVLHGGIVALAQPRPVPVLDPTKVEAWARSGRMLLLLDGIGNPHNLGAIVRTAAFFGVPRIVLSDHPAQARPSDASYRVAEGGLEHVELYRSVRFTQMLEKLRRSYRTVATAAEKGQPLTALRPGERPFALILGNEERGLTRETLRACDEIVTIPGSGSVQSLNVAATAAVLIHTLAGQAPPAA